MKIKDYISSLLPSFTKTRMTEDLGIVREELRNTTLPAYTSSVKAFGNSRFKSEELIKFEDEFKKNVKTNFRGGSIAVIEQTLKMMDENVDVAEKAINAYYTDDVMRESMTFLKVNLVQYLETASFVTRYARRHLIWAVALETEAVGSDGGYGQKRSMTEGEYEWLRVQKYNFFTALSIMGGFTPAEVEKNLRDIPDIVVTKDNAPVIEKTVGIQKLDPFQFGLIPVWLNPIYHVRMRIAEWQVKRFKAAQHEKEVIELRLLQLKQAHAGKSDARLAEQIEYNEGRLQKLNYELKEMEDQYA